MVFGDFIAVAVIVLVVGGATAYIIKAKKSGKKCIGCPDACFCNVKSENESVSCTHNCSSCAGCHKEKEN